MNVATFKLTLTLSVDKSQIGSMLEFLEETVELDPKSILGVVRVGSRVVSGYELPLFAVTVTEDALTEIADWFYRDIADFEIDFEVEWKTVEL